LPRSSQLKKAKPQLTRIFTDLFLIRVYPQKLAIAFSCQRYSFPAAMTHGHLSKSLNASNTRPVVTLRGGTQMPIPRKFALAVTCFLVAASAAAKEPKFYQRGVIAQMESVSCGHDENSGQGVKAVLLGTDSNHSKVRDALCQEYTVRADRVVYRIRPREEKHPLLLPVGEPADFRIKKDRMLLRVRELDDKEHEYGVVSMKPVEQ
jgi:hypothetical protein